VLPAPPSADQLARWNEELESASARQVLRWIFEELGGLRVGVTSAFGPEGCVLVELVRLLRPSTPVFTIDTGYLFREALEVREAYGARGSNVVVVEPLVTLRKQTRDHGVDLFASNPDRCCEIRKVEPMRRILDQMDVWVTAIRRDQSDSRRDTPLVGLASRGDGSQVIKVAPLVRWTRADTWGFLSELNLPYNPLLDQGYTSIGCQPCTTANNSGNEDGSERAGRWSGHGKTECGIHNL
jgi:phosphoadenosine phosphosulfate reductase